MNINFNPSKIKFLDMTPAVIPKRLDLIEENIASIQYWDRSHFIEFVKERYIISNYFSWKLYVAVTEKSCQNNYLLRLFHEEKWNSLLNICLPANNSKLWQQLNVRPTVHAEQKAILCPWCPAVTATWSHVRNISILQLPLPKCKHPHDLHKQPGGNV